MTPEECRQKILDIPFMNQLDEPLRTQVATVLLGISETRRVPKSSLLIAKGDEHSDRGYALLEGEVEIQKRGSGEITCYAPELMGEMKMFNPTRQRTATVQAKTELFVLAFNWSEFQRTLKAEHGEEAAEAAHKALESYAWQHFTE